MYVKYPRYHNTTIILLRHDNCSTQTPEPDRNWPLDTPCMFHSSVWSFHQEAWQHRCIKKEESHSETRQMKEYVKIQTKAHIFCLTREIVYALGSSSSLHAANLQLTTWLDVWSVL